MGSYEQSQEKRKWKNLDINVFLVLLCHEIRLGFKSPLQKGWVITVLFFGFLFILGERNLGAVSSLLSLFVFLGSLIALVDSSSSVSGEIGGIADSLLSKSVKRWEYILSKFGSNIIIVSVVYFAMVTLVVGILWNFEVFSDLNYRNLFFAVALIGLGLLFFSSIGVMFSSIFSKPIFSFLASIMVWFLLIFMVVVANWKLMYSPVEILWNFKLILEGSWDVEYWKILLFYIGSPFVFLIVSLVSFYRRDL